VNSFRLTRVNTSEGGTTLPALPDGLAPLADTGLNAKRKDTHKVVIAMASIPKPIDTARMQRGSIPAPATSHAILSTTEHQLQATAKERALFELDRQRMLVLLQQSPNLLVVP